MKPKALSEHVHEIFCFPLRQAGILPNNMQPIHFTEQCHNDLIDENMLSRKSSSIKGQICRLTHFNDPLKTFHYQLHIKCMHTILRQ